jgi:hypothetical protein
MRVFAVALVALLAGCKAETVQTVTVTKIIRPPSPPIPLECRAAARWGFQPIKEARQGPTGYERLEDAHLENKARAAANAGLSTRCECFLIGLHGNEQEKSDSKDRCSSAIS